MSIYPGCHAGRGPQAQVTLASDNVFSDGSALELATVTGAAASGFTAVLMVAI